MRRVRVFPIVGSLDDAPATGARPRSPTPGRTPTVRRA